MASLLRGLLVTASLCLAQSQLATNYIIVGNPGVGKSTILNGLIARHGAADAHFNYNAGVDHWFVEAGSNRYFEVLGSLGDAMQERATKITSDALQKDGVHKLIFVITLAPNGLRPEDVALMRSVLQATNIKSYSILVNLVSHHLESSVAQWFLTTLNQQLPVQSKSMYFILREQPLFEQLGQALNFIAMLPADTDGNRIEELPDMDSMSATPPTHESGNVLPAASPVLPAAAGHADVNFSLDDEETGGFVAALWACPLMKVGSVAAAAGLAPLLFPNGLRSSGA